MVRLSGGINMADEYINHIVSASAIEHGGIWLRWSGCVKADQAFLMNWYINRGEITDFDITKNKAVEGEGLYIHMGAVLPMYRTQVGKNVLPEYWRHQGNGLCLSPVLI